MELVNAIYLYPDLKDNLARSAIETVVQILSPFAPHMCEEIWREMGHTKLMHETPWPSYDVEKMAAQELQIVIQVNGKLKDRITVVASADEGQIKSEAWGTLEKKGIKIAPDRVIYVPRKLVNFVCKNN